MEQWLLEAAILGFVYRFLNVKKNLSRHTKKTLAKRLLLVFSLAVMILYLEALKLMNTCACSQEIGILNIIKVA